GDSGGGAGEAGDAGGGGRAAADVRGGEVMARRRHSQRLIRAYDEGVLTENELTWALIHLAEESSPEEVGADLPREWLLAIRRMTATPPLTFEQAPRSFYIGDNR